MFKKYLFLTFAMMLTGMFSTYAQSLVTPNEYNFYNSISYSFYSESVKDSFQVYISLPDNYDEATSDYPVLYVLDGDISFEMVTSIARYVQVGNNIPNLIIVGIGYGTLNKSAGNNRQRDYSPTKVGENNDTGGAANFLNFMQNELIPFIDSNFRTDKNDRTIYGYSLAGLFCFYTLFTQPDLFNNYIMGSAYLNWDNKVIFEIEKQSALKLTDIHANVFISVGNDEDDDTYFNPIDEMVSTLQNRGYKSLKISAMVFNNEDHLTAPPSTIIHGLLSVFEK